MIRPYREVLALPGALTFSAAGFLARMPISMLGIGIVLLVASRTGSYGVAGAVAATFGIVAAVAAPVLARLVDRLGQARVVRPAVCLNAVGLALLVLAAETGAPTWTLFAAAALAGASAMSVGALVRARWSFLIPAGAPRLHTAYSLESVLDELIFVVGPVVVTLLATRVAPPAGLVAATTAALVGGLMFAAQRRTEPPAAPGRPAAGGAVLRIPGMVVLSASFVGVGVLFGSVEVTTVAFTEERGVPAAAGLVLASFALGSLIAGLGYGAIHWRTPPGRRYLFGVALLSVGVVPVALVTSVPALVVVMFLAGFAISPMIIAGNALVQDIVPARRLTEGLTWVSTAIGLGTAVGAAVSGATIDAYGAHRAFLVTVAAGLLATATALVGARWLRPPAPVAPETRPEPEPRRERQREDAPTRVWQG
jgi:MFS family permease